MEQTLTPEQARWVVERLLAERRISSRDVAQYLADMGTEIQDIERRLANLRGTVGSAPVASRSARSDAVPAKARKRWAGGRKGHPRGIAGTLAVLLRSIPAAGHAAIAAIRAEKGIKAAISAAKAATKKA